MKWNFDRCFKTTLQKHPCLPSQQKHVKTLSFPAPPSLGVIVFIFVTKRTKSFQCGDHQWSVCISPKTCEAVRLFMCLLTNSIFSLNYLFLAFGHFSVRLYVLKPIRISFVCYICSKYFLSVIWILTFDSFFLVLKFFIFME